MDLVPAIPFIEAVFFHNTGVIFRTQMVVPVMLIASGSGVDPTLSSAQLVGINEAHSHVRRQD